MSVIIQEFHSSAFHDVESVIESYEYTSFGVPKDFNNSISKNRFTYTGREYEEESGLYYYRARYYEPELGRFISVDPDAGVIRIPTTLNNKYIYVLNVPTVGTDPSGEFWPIIIAAVIGGAANAYFNKGNGKDVMYNFAIGAAVGAGSAYAVGYFAGLAGPSIGWGMLYGAGAGAVSSIFGQMAINGTTSLSRINWTGVAFGGFAGAIAGGISAAAQGGFFSSSGMQTTVESVDAANKSTVQSLIEAPKPQQPNDGMSKVIPLH